MEPRCTCGALLPPDARFCHKCAKPQFEEDAVRLAELEAAAMPTPVPPPPAPRAAISFRNTQAVGISIGVAAAAFFCMLMAFVILPGLVPLSVPILLAGAGFAAALLYGRQSRQPLSGAGGARLGWMTGLWFFAAVMAIVTLTAISLSNPTVVDMWKQLQSKPEFAQLKIPDAKTYVSNLLGGAIQTFFLAVLFPVFGGVIGARFASKHRPSA